MGDDEEVIETFEPEETPSTNIQQEPVYVDILNAIDSEDGRLYFLQMLGYAPKYDKHGRIVGYTKVKQPDFDDQLMGFLSAIRSAKVMTIADFRGVEPLTPLELEWKVKQLEELILLQAPPDADLMHYLVPIEWAKLEMEKNMTVARNGRVVNSLLGVPQTPSNPPTYVEPAPTENVERKRGLLGKLLGR